VTDLVRIGKNRRPIFIWSKESRWIVATEHGGRVWNYPVFAFDIDRDHNAILVRTEAAAVNTVCATASSLLDDWRAAVTALAAPVDHVAAHIPASAVPPM
jgi:hypothetical protein